MRSRNPRRPLPNPATSSLKTALQRTLDASEPRIAVLAIGSTLRGDDAAGILVGEALDKRLSKLEASTARRATVSVFPGGTAPENFTGAIKEFNPTALVILDAVDIHAEPGSVHLIDVNTIDPGAGLSTHSISIRMLTDYLRQSLVCDVLIVGIQPGTLEFGASPTASVVKAAKSVAAAIAEVVTGC
jgi:hydrogenase 3 maturation protease